MCCGHIARSVGSPKRDPGYVAELCTRGAKAEAILDYSQAN